MNTGKIRALGWKPGGMPLFEQTMQQLAEKQGVPRPSSTQV